MAFDAPEVNVLFPVPLLKFKLQGHQALNRGLLAEIAERRRAEEGKVASNRYGGWHSDKDLFERKEPAHAQLAAELTAMLEAATAKMLPDAKRDQLRMFSEGWINVNPTHALNAPHDHTGSFWSGCYYVHVPKPEGDQDPLSGVIEFLDSRGQLGEGRGIPSPFTRGNHLMRPTAGTALIWPGFLKHWVHPNASAEERVTIAFNAWFKKAPTARAAR